MEMQFSVRLKPPYLLGFGSLNLEQLVEPPGIVYVVSQDSCYQAPRQ